MVLLWNRVVGILSAAERSVNSFGNQLGSASCSMVWAGIRQLLHPNRTQIPQRSSRFLFAPRRETCHVILGLSLSRGNLRQTCCQSAAIVSLLFLVLSKLCHAFAR